MIDSLAQLYEFLELSQLSHIDWQRCSEIRKGALPSHTYAFTSN